jgi:hypothetical protein
MTMPNRLYVSVERFPQVALRPIEYADPDDALGAAKNAIHNGLYVHSIETSDGRILMPADVLKLVRERSHLLGGRPRVR